MLWRDHDMRGYNFRTTGLHAVIGLAQMDRLDEFTEKRRANAAYLKRRNAVCLDDRHGATLE
jgi:dTDP-4-amino-4,6-dideoxygalactose transaminase